MTNKLRVAFLIFFYFLFSTLNGQVNDMAFFIDQLSKKFNLKVALDPNLLNEKININKLENMNNVYDVLTRANIDYYVIHNNYILLRKKEAKKIKEVKKISGKIVDEKTEEPLAYASIYLDDFTNGTSSDEYGNYSLNIPIDYKGKVICSYMGYENNEIKSQGITKLKQNEISIDNIVIIASNQPLNFLINKEQSDIYNSFKIFNLEKDIVREVQNLVPGVIKTDNAQILIRGMKQDKTSILVDNLPILQTGHYFNLISNYNEFYFNDIQLYKNNQPAEYQTSIAGLLNLQSRDFSNKTHFDLFGNLLYSGFNYHTSNQNISVNLGGRKSHIGVNKYGFLKDNFNQLSINSSIDLNSKIPDVSFYDFNGKLSYRINDNHKIDFSLFSSFDENYLEWENKKVLLPSNILLDNKFQSKSEFKHNAFGIKYESNLSNTLSLHANANSYNYFEDFYLSSILKIERKSGVISDNDINSQIQNYNTKNLTAFINKKFNTSNLKFGYSLQKLEIGQVSKENQKIINDEDGNSYNHKLFTEYYHKIGKLNLIGNTKLNYFSNLDVIKPEYGVFGFYDISEAFQLKGSIAYKIQNINHLDYETRFGQILNYYILTNSKPNLTSSNQSMVGLNISKGNFMLDIEAYQYFNKGNLLLSNIIPPKPKGDNNFPPQIDNIFNIYLGDNKIIGIDFGLSYKVGSFNNQLNYTLSSNQQRFNGIYKNQWMPSPNDRRHILSFNTVYRKKNFSIGGNFSNMSGTPYISFRKLKPNNIKKDINRKDIIEYLPDYLSLDLNTDYEFSLKPIKVKVGISVNNLTNNTNILFVQQSASIKNDKEINPIILGNQNLLLGRFFNLHLKLSL